MIGILDYRCGNLRSVQKAFEKKGHAASILSKPEELAQVSHLLLPGVGAFADGMKHLKEQGLDGAVRGWVAAGKPFLGICLGMQLLFESSEESPDGQPVAGLGILPGSVKRFIPRPGLKVPHMGWNALTGLRGPLYAGVAEGAHVYFVHGYYCAPSDASLIAASCDYGGDFCASVAKGNILAAQFHPEKSQAVGLSILDNFAKWKP